MNRFATNKLTMGAVFSALSFIFLFLAGIVPGVEMSLYALASFMPAFMILEMKGKGGLLVYAATVCLALLIMPNKLAILPYAFFFGIYGIIKYYLEKLKNPILQVGTKILVFLTIFVIAYLFFKELFFANISLPSFLAGQTFIIIGLAGTLCFVLYDYIFTMVINYYIARVKQNH